MLQAIKTILIADLVMPGADGIQILSEVKRSDPDRIVILMTGYEQKAPCAAMLNAFAEVEAGGLTTSHDRLRFAPADQDAGARGRGDIEGQTHEFLGARLVIPLDGVLQEPDLDRGLAPVRARRPAQIVARMEGTYGKGKWCGPDYVPGKDEKADKAKCKDLQQLSEVLEKGGKYED